MHHLIGLDAGTNSTGFAVFDQENNLLDYGVDTFPMGNEVDKNGTEISRNGQRRIYRGIRRNRFRYHLRRSQLADKILKPMGMRPNAEEVISAYDLYALRDKALREQIDLLGLGRIFLLFNKYRGFKSSRKGTSPEDKKEEGVVLEQINWLKGRLEHHDCTTVGEYFFKMFQISQDLHEHGEWHNPDEPYDERGLDEEGTFSVVKSRGIRRDGRYMERAMIADEFDRVWEVQRKFYPNILTGNAEEYRSILERKDITPARRRELKKEFAKTAFHRIKHYTIFYQRPLKSPKKYIGKCAYEKNRRVAPLSSLDYQEFRVLKQLIDLRYSDPEFPEILNQSLDDEQRGKVYVELQKTAKLSFAEVKRILGLKRQTQINTEELGKELLGNATRAGILEAIGQSRFEKLTEQELEKLWHVLYMSRDDQWLRETLADPDKWALEENTVEKLLEVHLPEGYGSYSAKVVRKILPHLKQGTHEREALKAEGYFVEQTDASRKLKTRISEVKNNEMRNPVVEKATMRVVRLVNALIKKHDIDPEKLTIRVESTRELKKPKKAREQIRRQNLDTETRRKQYADFLTSYGKFGRIHVGDRLIHKFELWLELGESESDLKEFQKFLSDTKKDNLNTEKYRLWLEQGMKCPYTFKTIPLSSLLSPEVEIEHIIPYSRSMDNSFVNKTLCYAAANKDKSNLTSYEYMKRRGAGNLTAFKYHIGKVFGKESEKQKRFLQEKIPQDFRPDQLTNTSYIARQIRAKLQEVSRDVQFTNGAATAALRRMWRVSGLLDEVMYEEQTGVELWRHFGNRHDPDNQAEIEKYHEWRSQFGKGKNRSDHRHHALDAIVVGLCSPGIVQKISTFHRVREELRIAADGHEGKIYRGSDEYRLPPLPISEATIKEALKKILVASQTNQRLLVRQKNTIKTKDGKKTQKTRSVRGALFQETFYGKLKEPEKQGFEKDDVFVSRKVLTPDLIPNEKALDKVVDANVREILRLRLHKYNGKSDAAFSQENMEREPIYMYSISDYPDGSPNPTSKKGNALPVIKRVRIAGKNARSFVQIPAKNQQGEVKATNRWAEKDGNHIMALYELLTKTKSGKVKKISGFELLSDAEAVQKHLDRTPLFPDEITNEKGQTLSLNPFCPSLKKGDFVVFYEENPSEIQWNDREDIFKRLYQVTGLGSLATGYGVIKLVKHNVSRANASYPNKTYDINGPLPYLMQYNTQISAIKVKVNQLGEVTPLVPLPEE